MPFRSKEFNLQIEIFVEGPLKEELLQKSTKLLSLKNPQEKAKCIKEITDLMDEKLEKETKKDILEACGGKCIGSSILKKALVLQKQSANIDDLLNKVNSAHIGGGHLVRKENIIFAQYDKCYCGSVNRSKERFSETFCYCSCGWYKQLFETLIQKSITIELVNSILQGNSVCQFQIHI